MDKTGLHPGLEARLTALAARIATLKRKMSQAEGLEKIEAFGEIEELERRYKTLEDRLRMLTREGPGFRQDMKAEIEKVTDDLTGTVQDFTMWIDSGYHPDRRPKPPAKS